MVNILKIHNKQIGYIIAKRNDIKLQTRDDNNTMKLPSPIINQSANNEISTQNESLLQNEKSNKLNNLDEIKSKRINGVLYLNIIKYKLNNMIRLNEAKIKLNNIIHLNESENKLGNKVIHLDEIKNNNVKPHKYNFKINRNKNDIVLVFWSNLLDENYIIDIIKEFKKIHVKNPNIYLKIISDVKCTNNNFIGNITNNNDGIIFKHNLNHRDLCYEIASSDIGINNFKNEYNIYNLDFIYDIQQRVGVVTVINKSNNIDIDNYIVNFKQQIYFNKKLFVIVNNNNINVRKYEQILKENDIEYDLQFIDGKHSFGYCLNCAISKMKEQHIDIFSVFNHNNIYEPKYLLEQIKYLNKFDCEVVGKQNTLMFVPENYKFYKNINKKEFQYTESCDVDTITFKLSKVYINFDTYDESGKYFSKNKKIYVTSINNYIQITHITEIDTLQLIEYEPYIVNGQIFNIIFGKIYVLNLKKDTLKKEIFIQNNKKTNIYFTFFEGVYGEKNDDCINIYKTYIDKQICYDGCSALEKKYKKKMIHHIGQIGYLQSMLKIFEECVRCNLSKVMIFDDDVILHNNFNKLFLNTLKTINNYHILRLGCTTYNITKNKQNLTKPYFKSIDCDGSFATCYSKECFKYMIDNIKIFNVPYDSGCLRDYKKYTSNVDYTCYDFLAIADTIESQTSGKSRNLYELSFKLAWQLENFWFVNSLRKISVIFPIFNKEKTVINSIKSILNQTYKNIEIILVNDCSTDNTSICIKNFMKSYNGKINIIYIEHDTNKGCYEARNTGIKHSSGNFIAFQDPDDFSFPNRLEIQMNDIIKKNIMISTAGIYRLKYHDVNDIYEMSYLVQKDMEYSVKNNLQLFNEIKLGMATAIIDKKIFDKYGYYNSNIRHSQDLWYILKVYINAYNENLRCLNNKVGDSSYGFFHTFISGNKDKYNFIYYNNTLTYVSNRMLATNISNIYSKRQKLNDYNTFLKINNINH